MHFPPASAVGLECALHGLTGLLAVQDPRRAEPVRAAKTPQGAINRWPPTMY